MSAVVREIEQITQALDQGKLGNWPVVSLAADGAKLVFSMRQLLVVVESRLVVLEAMVARQEDEMAQ